jgi:hypothetical protein
MLRMALVDGVEEVAVFLRPEMGACIGLIDWLANWQKEFSQNRRRMIIVTSDTRQLQYIELSHPDQNLTFVTSIEELLRKYPWFSSTAAEVAERKKPGEPGQEKPSSPPPVPAPQPALSEPLPESAPRTVSGAAGPQPAPQPAPVAPSAPRTEAPPPLPAAPPPQPAAPPVSPPEAPAKVMAGQVVQLSGEYACFGCQATRMYAKGDTAVACPNPECTGQQSGWKLVFELF